VVAGKLAGCRVVWHLNDTSSPWFIKKIFSILSGLPDAYIYASERTRNYYESMMNNKKMEFVIPAPVNTSYFSPQFEVKDNVPLKHSRGKIVIGMVANINTVKGIDTFIKVAANLNKEFKNLYFIVVGKVFKNQQKYYESLVMLCNELSVENIEFIGDSNDVKTILKNIDLYLCTSRAESSPIAVWEAMSMSKAIVSTNVGDVALYVRSGESGDIASVDNVDEITNKVESILSDSKLKNKYQKAAREIAVECLDISISANKQLHAYQDIISIDN